MSFACAGVPALLLRCALATLALLLVPAAAQGQKGQSPGKSVVRGIAAKPDIGVNIWIPAGSVRVVGWERDSVHIQATVVAGGNLFMGGGSTAMKVGVDEPPPGEAASPAHITAYVPRGARLIVRTATASIEASDVSGWYNTVSGAIRITGTASDVQADAIDGSITIASVSPHVRARTGGGTLTVGGRVEDLVASTVSGGLEVTAGGLTRGRLESMTGAIVLAAAIERASTIDIDNHNGSVELRLPASAAADFSLTSVAGSITNLFDKRVPSVGRQGRGQELSFVTDPKGARVVVRTFRGPITLRRQ